MNLYKSGSDPWVETLVSSQTFPSGLIEKKFRRVCLTSDADQAKTNITGNASQLSVSFSDGLATIEWVTWESGAYTGSLRFGSELITVSKSYSEAVTLNGDTTQYDWSILEVWLSDTVTKTTIIPALSSSWALSFSATCGKNLNQRKITGNPKPGAQNTINITWNTQIIAVNRRNFGTLDEADTTVGNVPSY